MDEETVQCAAMTRAGRRCRRRAMPGSAFCRQHADGPAYTQLPLPLGDEYEPAPRGPFAGLFTPEELAALEGCLDDPCVDDVVPVLLVSIRRAMAGGAQPNVVVRACEAYLRALRERRSAAGGRRDDDGLDVALDRLSTELGVEL